MARNLDGQMDLFKPLEVMPTDELGNIQPPLPDPNAPEYQEMRKKAVTDFAKVAPFSIPLGLGDTVDLGSEYVPSIEDAIKGDSAVSPSSMLASIGSAFDALSSLGISRENAEKLYEGVYGEKLKNTPAELAGEIVGIPVPIAATNAIVKAASKYGDKAAKYLDNILEDAREMFRAASGGDDVDGMSLAMAGDGTSAVNKTTQQTDKAFTINKSENSIRDDAKYRVDNPGYNEVYGETYAQTKQRSADEAKQKAKDRGETDTYAANLGTSEGITGFMDDATFRPEELKDIPGAMGEEKYRATGETFIDGEKAHNKLEALKKSIADEGYNPEGNILIHVREDGQPFIVEGNHRLAEALESGRESIKADIRYLRGAEEADGPLKPADILPQKDRPADRVGYNVENPVFHATKQDFNRINFVPPNDADIGFHVGTPEQADFRLPYSGDIEGSALQRRDYLEQAEGARVLKLALKENLNPLRIPDLGAFKEPKNWLGNLSVAKSDRTRIRFMLDEPEDADLLAKAPRVRIDNEVYFMLPDVMRSGMDAKVWEDITRAAHDASRETRSIRDLAGAKSPQQKKQDWFNTIKETVNKHGYDSFVYQNEYEGPYQMKDSYMLLEPDQVKSVFGGMTAGDPDLMKHKGGLMLQKGGAVPMKEQMELFAEGGLEQDGGTKDPVSGNDVPIGSSQEEVRDDIPAQLSEGEFVFPADVVRYHGLDKLMKLRQEAKMGLKMMDEMGQMGNSDEATIPDDLPFEITDLIIVDGTDKKEYNVGGLVNDQQQAGIMFQAPQTQQETTVGQAQAFTPVGQAATPIPMAQVYSPVQQQQTPVYQAPETLPTAKEFIGGTGGAETITIVNEETGEERMITFIPGVTEIPAGFVRKEDYVPKQLAPETQTTRVETAQVREDREGPGDDAEQGQSMGFGGDLNADGTISGGFTLSNVSFSNPNNPLGMPNIAGIMSGQGLSEGDVVTGSLPSGATVTLSHTTVNAARKSRSSEASNAVADMLGKTNAVMSTTGKPSQETFSEAEMQDIEEGFNQGLSDAVYGKQSYNPETHEGKGISVGYGKGQVDPGLASALAQQHNVDPSTLGLPDPGSATGPATGGGHPSAGMGLPGNADGSIGSGAGSSVGSGIDFGGNDQIARGGYIHEGRKPSVKKQMEKSGLTPKK